MTDKSVADPDVAGLIEPIAWVMQSDKDGSISEDGRAERWFSVIHI